MVPVDCPVCLSRGFVLASINNYMFKYKCTCRHGDFHKYEGPECVKLRSDYYCASIDELPSGMVDEIIKDNCKKYGISKVAGRWMKDPDFKLTKEMLDEYRKLASQIVGQFDLNKAIGMK